MNSVLQCLWQIFTWQKIGPLIFLFLGSVGAWAQANSKDYDHIRTGFSLTGSHANSRCESCHVNGVFKGTPRDCGSCHVSGTRLAKANTVKPPQHFATQQACDVCHTTITFTGASFDHIGVAPTSCGTCHNGSTTAGKPSGHIATQAACSACHRTSAWIPATGMDHSLFTAATNCTSCHNGSAATGKAANHMPTTLNCVSCHTTSTWKPSKWNHTQMPVVNQCSTCHSGAYPPADGVTSNHIPYKTLSGVAITNCDSCHKGGYSSWDPGQFHSNVSVSTQCASCHLTASYGATAKPATAIHAAVTGNCENCHKSTSTWLGSKPDHSLFTAATNCTSCHNGSAATGKAANHMPTALNCVSCHTTSTWKPSKWSHTQMPVVNQCSTCHSGAYPPADGVTSNHIPYKTLSGVAITNCDSCHKGGYVSWNPGQFHRNVSVATQCATCHLTGIYGLTAKPATATHATITGTCENCHKSTGSWLSVQFTHSAANAVGTGTCDTCHNGTAALGKTPRHIPVTTGPSKCDSCHKSQVAFSSALTMNHSVVVGTGCSLCHNGSYLNEGPTGALAKPINHIPLVQLLNGASMECNACHTSTTNWQAQKMNHNSSLGNGAGFCKGCHQSGINYLGSYDKKSLNHRNKTPAPTDCSQSGCHRPLGNTGTPYSKWDD